MFCHIMFMYVTAKTFQFNVELPYYACTDVKQSNILISSTDMLKWTVIYSNALLQEVAFF